MSGSEFDFIWILISAVAGIYTGVRMEAARWRSKGDHDYMNTCESAGSLYTVKRQQ